MMFTLDLDDKERCELSVSEVNLLEGDVKISVDRLVKIIANITNIPEGTSLHDCTPIINQMNKAFGTLENQILSLSLMTTNTLINVMKLLLKDPHDTISINKKDCKLTEVNEQLKRRRVFIKNELKKLKGLKKIIDDIVSKVK